jgi:2-dehydro-3-deoxyphosphooctonate aldolase (KDO 8-P synthase)
MRLAGHEVGLDRPLFLIAGPCAIESRELAIETAGRLKELTAAVAMPFIYKSSFDKANRSSGRSFRGPGIDEGLRILAGVREQIGVPVLTDVHESDQIGPVADVVDVLQTPAFLCRQTDFINAVAASGKPANIKKGQFLAPGETGCPVVFDATHSVQLPGGQGDRSGGQREFVPVLARAAIASGISGLFMETHPDPDKALSDGPNAWPLGRMAELLALLAEMDALVKRRGFVETELAA